MVRNQFLPEPLEPGLQPFGLDGLKRNSVNSRSAVVLLGQPIGFAQRLQLADMHVQSPKPPGRFSLRLCAISSAAVLADRWVPLSSHPCLASWSEEAQTAGSLCSTDIAPRHRYYGPFRRPLLFGRLPGLAGYTAYPAPPFSRREEEGFSSCSA